MKTLSINGQEVSFNNVTNEQANFILSSFDTDTRDVWNDSALEQFDRDGNIEEDSFFAKSGYANYNELLDAVVDATTWTIEYDSDDDTYTLVGFNGWNSFHRVSFDLNMDEVQAWANLANAIENGDVVVNENQEEFLRHTIDSEDYQVFCKSGVRWSDGWIDSNGNPEEGVTQGTYWLKDEYNHWSDEVAVWSKNTDCGNPYTISDFKWNGSFIEIR